jgi:hypothetical protein
MNTSAADFLKKLRKFVQDEANAQMSSLEQQWSHPLNERIAKGWAIEGLHVGQFKNGIAHLTCTTNESRFREGNLVLLHRGSPRDPEALHFDLQYDGETELDASLIRGNEYLLAKDLDGWIMDQDWFDASSFYLAALDTVADSNAVYGRDKSGTTIGTDLFRRFAGNIEVGIGNKKKLVEKGVHS